ncbi:MAG: Small acid-soluble spore protein family [Paenibacillus sp.]|jgi:small acid-soluble spore protein H (minor)|uniref:H-type small acid-soluble spore protein n=1 Tax=Paenibacillus sp. GCM10012303 TaxID=3317340 RepID=UPI0029EA5893|nr:Small acid-soluble spore protein family [Paenibacillus sp.]
MDYDRAQRILLMSDKVEVTWQGESVWIDSVDKYSGVATIHPENDPRVSKNVPITELQEHGTAPQRG